MNKSMVLLFILLCFSPYFAEDINQSSNSTENLTFQSEVHFLFLTQTRYFQNHEAFDKPSYMIDFSLANKTAAYDTFTAQTSDYVSEPFEVSLNISSFLCSYDLLYTNISLKSPKYSALGGAGCWTGSCPGCSNPSCETLCISNIQPAEVKSVWGGLFDGIHCANWPAYMGLPCAQCTGTFTDYEEYEIVPIPKIEYVVTLSIKNSKNETITETFSENTTFPSPESQIFFNWSTGISQACSLNTSDFIALNRTSDQRLLVVEKNIIPSYLEQISMFESIPASSPASLLDSLVRSISGILTTSAANLSKTIFVSNSKVSSNPIFPAPISFTLLINSEFIGAKAVEHPVPIPVAPTIIWSSGGSSGAIQPTPQPTKASLNISILSPKNNSKVESPLELSARIENSTEVKCSLALDDKETAYYIENNTLSHIFLSKPGNHSLRLSCTANEITEESQIFFEVSETPLQEHPPEIVAASTIPITAQATSQESDYSGVIVVFLIIAISTHTLLSMARRRRGSSNQFQ